MFKSNQTGIGMKIGIRMQSQMGMSNKFKSIGIGMSI